MKVLTVGNGFIANHLPYTKALERLEPNANQINSFLKKHKPDVIINCIARTGTPNIDWCETNKEETAIANTVISILLAIECEKFGTNMIQIGSGCIFSGQSPNIYRQQTKQGKKNISINEREGDWITIDGGFRETDHANPQSYYACTKAAADLVMGDMPNCTILRIRMPISDHDIPRNLINKLLNYKQIIDIKNSMTLVSDLVNCIDWAIDQAMENGQCGIFNVVNPEPLTAAMIMNEYKKHIPEHDFEIINEKQLDKLTLAKRSNCILDGSKLKNAGFKMSNTEEALKNCMTKYIKNKGK